MPPRNADFGATGVPARTRGKVGFGATGVLARIRAKGWILEIRAPSPVQVELLTRLRSLLVRIRHAQNRALSKVFAENLHTNWKLCFRHAHRN